MLFVERRDEYCVHKMLKTVKVNDFVSSEEQYTQIFASNNRMGFRIFKLEAIDLINLIHGICLKYLWYRHTIRL